MQFHQRQYIAFKLPSGFGCCPFKGYSVVLMLSIIGITQVFSCINIPSDDIWTLGLAASCSNSFHWTRQVLMQWNKHVWSLFLHILPDFYGMSGVAILYVEIFVLYIEIFMD